MRTGLLLWEPTREEERPGLNIYSKGQTQPKQIMDVFLGPTFSIGVSSAPEYVRDQNGVSPVLEEHGSASSCLFLKEEEKGGVGKSESGFGLFGRGKDPDEDDSDASSSIGDQDDDSEEGDGDSSKSDRVDEEVQSKLNRGLDSLGSLEDSLPTKKGLSNHFAGKSKSFTNLSDAFSAKDLEKPENPFNKRRRLLMAAKLSRKSSFYTWHNPKSMPLLAVKEDDEEEALRPQSSPRVNNPGADDDDDEEEEEAVSNLPQRRLKNMKSFSCFSLSEMDNHQL